MICFSHGFTLEGSAPFIKQGIGLLQKQGSRVELVGGSGGVEAWFLALVHLPLQILRTSKPSFCEVPPASKIQEH